MPVAPPWVSLSPGYSHCSAPSLHRARSGFHSLVGQTMFERIRKGPVGALSLSHAGSCTESGSRPGTGVHDFVGSVA